MPFKNLTEEDKSARDGMEPSPDQLRARERLYQLAERQGIAPITIEELKAMGDLWPEDENIEDFLAALREWRGERSERLIR